MRFLITSPRGRELNHDFTVWDIYIYIKIELIINCARASDRLYTRTPSTFADTSTAHARSRVFPTMLNYIQWVWRGGVQRIRVRVCPVFILIVD